MLYNLLFANYTIFYLFLLDVLVVSSPFTGTNHNIVRWVTFWWIRYKVG